MVLDREIETDIYILEGWKLKLVSDVTVAYLIHSKAKDFSCASRPCMCVHMNKWKVV